MEEAWPNILYNANTALVFGAIFGYSIPGIVGSTAYWILTGLNIEIVILAIVENRWYARKKRLM
jgi:hypothetical protein